MRTQGRHTMRFTHLQLENWRNFSHVDIELQRRVFLVGPNASGKSNLLDVFRFLRDIAGTGGGLQDAVRRRGGVSLLRCLAARRYSDITITVRTGAEAEGPAWTYGLSFNQDSRQRPIIKREIVTRGDNHILSRPNDEDEQDQERLTQTHLEQVSANKDFRQIVDLLTSVRYLHIVPQLVREPDRSVGRANDPFGGDFLEQIARTSEKTRNARLRYIRKALAVAVPQLGELDMERDQRGTPHLRGRYEHWRPQGAWQQEDAFSDGTLRLIGLLWALLDGSGPLLLEEPELSLHPEVVRYIPQLVARTQKPSGRQVILSTHSSDLLRDDGIGLDEVILVCPEEEGSSVSPAAHIRGIRDLLDGGSTIADIVMPRTRPERAEQLALLFGE